MYRVSYTLKDKERDKQKVISKMSESFLGIVKKNVLFVKKVNN